MAKKIFLTPSNQPENRYAYGGTNEMVQCGKIAEACKKALERNGFEVRIAHQVSLEEKVSKSNEWGADLHVPIHTNAFNGKVKGTRLFCYSISGNGYKACKAIMETLSPIVPGESDGISERQDLYEIVGTVAPVAYIEAGFHDNVDEAKWIVSHITELGEAIANGICKYYNVAEKAPAEPQENIYRVFNSDGQQVGAYSFEDNAFAEVKKQLKNSGSAKITYGAK